MSADEQPQSPGENLALALIGLVALILLVASPWLVDRSGPDPYYKGPLIYPQLVLAIIVVAALRPAIQAIRHPTGIRGIDLMPRRSLGVFALMCAFPVMIAAIGLAPACLLAMALGLITARQSWQRSLIIAIAGAAVLWLLFKGLLDIWFPQPWLLDMVRG
ncbi:tripartite tricarboxylate transporter TctB family protein [Paracoccus albus]|uniref:tripartite tricarboxylate transporter TctB family protein n=1 Tax=Paracoccus albus TaxID=3017784 RepID=UPI0022F0B364|nr:tripartite tricarboxylate transporter TctB family protein [Paracoccus albus]WBU62128.1 tripartite tricarboxylate transporter TctB family protein [Paracoccus albus]